MTLFVYLLRQLAIAVGFSLSGFAVLVLPTIAIQAIHKLGGVSLTAVAEYLPLVLVEMVPYLVPLGFLLGVVATYGRLAAEGELTAIRMAGIGPIHLLLPGMVLALGLFVGTDWVVGTLVPHSKWQRADYIRQAKEQLFRHLGRGRTEFEFGRIYFKASRRDPDDPNRFYDVILNAPDEDGEDRVLMADAATFHFDEDSMRAVFENFVALTASMNPYGETLDYPFPLSMVGQRNPRERNRAKYQTTVEIRDNLRAGAYEAAERQDAVYQIHKRHALAATYVIFLLLGIPTGILLRSGTQLGAFTGAIGYAFLYYLLALRLGAQLAQFGAVPPVLAAWATNGLFLALGVVLCWRVLWR